MRLQVFLCLEDWKRIEYRLSHFFTSEIETHLLSFQSNTRSQLTFCFNPKPSLSFSLCFFYLVPLLFRFASMQSISHFPGSRVMLTNTLYIFWVDPPCLCLSPCCLLFPLPVHLSPLPACLLSSPFSLWIACVLATCLSVSLFAAILSSFSIHVPLSFPVLTFCLPAYLFCLSAHVPVCLPTCESFPLIMSLSVGLHAWLYVFLPVCHPTCLPFWHG